MRACLWKLHIPHFSICFFTVVGLQFWTLSCKFPSHPSWYFFYENLHIVFVFSVYLIFGMMLVPGVGCLLSRFSPVGFFSGHWPMGCGGRCIFFVLAPATPGCGLSVHNRPSQSDTCSHLLVFFPGWRVKTNNIPMTHAINSNTNLLSIDITRMHTQMRKNLRGEKESGKEMRRDRE